MNHPVLIPWPKISPHINPCQAGYSEDTVSRPPTTPRVPVPLGRATTTQRTPGRLTKFVATMMIPPLFLYYVLNPKR